MTNPLMEEFTLESWHLTEPNFSNPAVFVSAFKHAVQPGHFVKVIHIGQSELVLAKFIPYFSK